MRRKQIQTTVMYDTTAIRVLQSNNATYYSVVDFVGALTDSQHAKTYWGKVKASDPLMEGSYTKAKLAGDDGKYRYTDIATREGLLRIVQSIPSPKAEPIKQWLAGLGEEEQQRREDPERGLNRDVDKFRNFLSNKGYSKEYISKRVESVIARNTLTDLIKDLNLPFKPDYAKITTLVNRYVFDMLVKQHKEYKDIDQKQTLRQHMVWTELHAISTAETGLYHAIKKAAPTSNDELLKIVKASGQLFSDVMAPSLKQFFGVDSLASPLSAKRDKNLLT